jgi:hypothetical protein
MLFISSPPSTSLPAYLIASGECVPLSQKGNPLIGLPRQQRYGFVSISAGRRVAVWSVFGAQRIVQGPATIFVWGARIQVGLTHAWILLRSNNRHESYGGKTV